MQFFEDSTCFQKHLGKSFSEIENPYKVSPYLYYMSHATWVKPQSRKYSIIVELLILTLVRENALNWKKCNLNLETSLTHFKKLFQSALDMARGLKCTCGSFWSSILHFQ